MKNRVLAPLIWMLLAPAIPLSFTSVAASNSVTVSVSPSTVVNGQNFTVSGNVVAASGNVAGTSVLIEVVIYNGSMLASATTSVRGAGESGTYSQNFTAGTPPSWQVGIYNVSASYSAGGAAVSNSTAFVLAECLCGGISLSTVTSTTTASESLMYGQPAISQGFVSHYNSSIDVYMWVSAMNPAGQTVGVFIGSAVLETSVPTTIDAVLFNLPSGTCAATVFVTTTSGVPVSSTSTISAFSV